MPAPTASDLIDIVDADDRVVDTAPRGAVLGSGRNFRTAHVILAGADGSVVLQKLAGGRERHPERWGSSVAAYLHAGESYRRAAERRLEEELGLRTVLRDLGRVSFQDGNSTKFVALFSGVAEDGMVIREPDHVAALRPWTPGEIATTMRTAPNTFTPTLLALLPRWLEAGE